MHEVVLKLLDIDVGPLATRKLFPRLKQIFDGDDTLIGMSELEGSHISEVTPPPAASAIATESEKRIPLVVRLLPSHAKDSQTFSWSAS